MRNLETRFLFASIYLHYSAEFKFKSIIGKRGILLDTGLLSLLYSFLLISFLLRASNPIETPNANVEKKKRL